MTRRWWRQLAQFAQGPADAAALNLPGNIHASRENSLLVLRRQSNS